MTTPIRPQQPLHPPENPRSSLPTSTPQGVGAAPSTISPPIPNQEPPSIVKGVFFSILSLASRIKELFWSFCIRILEKIKGKEASSNHKEKIEEPQSLPAPLRKKTTEEMKLQLLSCFEGLKSDLQRDSILTQIGVKYRSRLPFWKRRVSQNILVGRQAMLESPFLLLKFFPLSPSRKKTEGEKGLELLSRFEGLESNSQKESLLTQIGKRQWEKFPSWQRYAFQTAALGYQAILEDPQLLAPFFPE